ncbi:MAG: 50S ribosomal protein L11 methyltransferase [Proteobacteria bacterium]|nr:50S ribosomal protein L11 methyltransferase [Pseudomonadota bacterium]
MSDKWIEIRVEGPLNKKDDIITALIEAGSPGVLECDPENKKQTGTNPTLMLKAYLPGNLLKSKTEIKALKSAFKELKSSVELDDYEDEDWSVKWKEVIRPVTITDSATGTTLIIKASWHKIESKARRRVGEKMIVLTIDPSMAFGTGSHPSTKMCLRALLYITQSEDGNGAYGPINNLLDVGSGTGVLAIAAKHLGVKKSVGIDNDPVTVKIAKDNAKLNKVTCTFKEGADLNDVKGTFDMVVANIISNTLIKLKEEICRKVKPGGFAILSGILSEEARETEDAYTKLGFTPYMRYAESASQQGGDSWVALVLRKAY